MLLGIHSQKIFHIYIMFWSFMHLHWVFCSVCVGGGGTFCPLPVSFVVNLALPLNAFAQIGTSYYVIKSKFENQVYTGIQWRF